MNNTSITIVGNATRDPELRFTASGMATVTFNVAVNRRIPARNGANPTEAVSFFTVVAWQQLAENISLSVHKGTRIVVTGRLDQRTWEGAGGERKTSYELVADDVGTSLKWANATVEKATRVTPTAEFLHGVVFGGDAPSPDGAIDPTHSLVPSGVGGEPFAGPGGTQDDDLPF